MAAKLEELQVARAELGSLQKRLEAALRDKQAAAAALTMERDIGESKDRQLELLQQRLATMEQEQSSGGQSVGANRRPYPAAAVVATPATPEADAEVKRLTEELQLTKAQILEQQAEVAHLHTIADSASEALVAVEGRRVEAESK